MPGIFHKDFPSRLFDETQKETQLNEMDIQNILKCLRIQNMKIKIWIFIEFGLK